MSSTHLHPTTVARMMISVDLIDPHPLLLNMHTPLLENEQSELDASISPHGGCVEPIKLELRPGARYRVWDGLRRVESHRRLALSEIYAEFVPDSYRYMKSEEAQAWWRLVNWGR